MNAATRIATFAIGLLALAAPVSARRSSGPLTDETRILPPPAGENALLIPATPEGVRQLQTIRPHSGAFVDPHLRALPRGRRVPAMLTLTPPAGILSVPRSRSEINEPGRVRWIPAAAQELSRRWEGSAFRPLFAFRLLPIMVVGVDPAILDTLGEDPLVESVTATWPLELTTEEGLDFLQIADDPLTPSTDPAFLRDSGYNADGDGVTVALLDSGISPAWAGPDLYGRVAYKYNYMANTGDPAPEAPFHGTRMAAIIAGEKGVAPKAKLWDLQVVPAGIQAAEVTNVNVIRALYDILVATSDPGVAGGSPRGDCPVDVVNMSVRFGGEKVTDLARCEEKYRPLKYAVDALTNAGIILVAATGNDGANGMMISRYKLDGTSPTQVANELSQGLFAPACLSNVISVGSVWDADPDGDFVGAYGVPASPMYSCVASSEVGCQGLDCGSRVESPDYSGYSFDCQDTDPKPGKIACYSNYKAQKPSPGDGRIFGTTTFAPGEMVNALHRQDETGHTGQTCFIGGTSSATAYASGVAALMKAIFRTRVDASILASALAATGKEVIGLPDPGPNEQRPTIISALQLAEHIHGVVKCKFDECSNVAASHLAARWADAPQTVDAVYEAKVSAPFYVYRIEGSGFRKITDCEPKSTKIQFCHPSGDSSACLKHTEAAVEGYTCDFAAGSTCTKPTVPTSLSLTPNRVSALVKFSGGFTLSDYPQCEETVASRSNPCLLVAPDKLKLRLPVFVVNPAYEGEPERWVQLASFIELLEDSAPQIVSPAGIRFWWSPGSGPVGAPGTFLGSIDITTKNVSETPIVLLEETGPDYNPPLHHPVVIDPRPPEGCSETPIACQAVQPCDRVTTILLYSDDERTCIETLARYNLLFRNPSTGQESNAVVIEIRPAEAPTPDCDPIEPVGLVSVGYVSAEGGSSITIDTPLPRFNRDGTLRFTKSGRNPLSAGITVSDWDYVSPTRIRSLSPPASPGKYELRFAARANLLGDFLGTVEVIDPAFTPVPLGYGMGVLRAEDAAPVDFVTFSGAPYAVRLFPGRGFPGGTRYLAVANGSSDGTVGWTGLASDPAAWQTLKAGASPVTFANTWVSRAGDIAITSYGQGGVAKLAVFRVDSLAWPPIVPLVPVAIFTGVREVSSVDFQGDEAGRAQRAVLVGTHLDADRLRAHYGVLDLRSAGSPALVVPFTDLDIPHFLGDPFVSTAVVEGGASTRVVISSGSTLYSACLSELLGASPHIASETGLKFPIQNVLAGPGNGEAGGPAYIAIAAFFQSGGFVVLERDTMSVLASFPAGTVGWAERGLDGRFYVIERPCPELAYEGSCTVAYSPAGARVATFFWDERERAGPTVSVPRRSTRSWLDVSRTSVTLAADSAFDQAQHRDVLIHEIDNIRDAMEGERSSVPNLVDSAKRHGEDWIVDADVRGTFVSGLDAIRLSGGWQ